MSQDIKIGVSVDASNIRSAGNYIDGLASKLERVNRGVDRMSQSVSKINTGNLNQASRPGAIKSGPQGQVTGLTAQILGDPNQAEKAVDRIIRSFDRLEQRASRMASSSSKFRGNDAGWSIGAFRSIEQNLNQNDAGWSRGFSGGGASGGSALAPSGAPVHQVPTAGGGRGGGGGGRGFGSSGALSGGAQGLLYGAAGGVEALASGNIGAFLGSTVGRLGIAGVAGYAGYRIADAISSWSADAEKKNINYQVQYPLVQEQAVGSGMAPFKSFGRAALSGNIIQMSAFREATQSPAYQVLIDPAKREKLVQAKLDEWTVSGRMKNYLQDTVDPMSGRAGGYMKSMTPGSIGEDGRVYHGGVADDLGRHAIARKFAEAEIISQSSSDVQSLVEAKVHQNTSVDEYYGNAYAPSSSLSRIKTMRSLGRSTAPIKFKDGSTAQAYEWLQAEALGQGRDFGDMSAEFHQVQLGIGRGYNKIFGGYGAVSAGEAGFGNITQLAKMAGTLIGSVSGAGAIVSNVQGMTNGADGLDVTVGRDLFQNLAQTALGSGMYGGSSLNQVNRMVGTFVNAGGGNVAEQQRNAYAYGLGGQLEQTYTSGSRSPFDKVSSWQDSIYGTGGVFDASTIRLQEMGATDPRLLASIGYGGAKVPTWAEGLIDQGMARRYLESERKRPFATVVDELWAAKPKQADILRKIRAGNNDPNAFFESRLEGLDVGSKAWWKAERVASEEAGGILGGNKAGNAAMLSEEYLRTKTLNAPTGPGAHAPGGKDLEDASVKNASSYLKEVSKAMTSEAKAKVREKYGLDDHMAQEIIMRSTGTDIPSLSDAFVKAASDLAAAIKNRAANTPKATRAP